MDFRGRTVIVTGAGDGIGRAAAFVLAARGADVVVADQFEGFGETTRRLIAQAGGNAMFHRTDVSQTPSVAEMISAAVSWTGHVDVLVHCAAIPSRGMLISNTRASDLDRVMAVNLRGAFLCAREFVKNLSSADRRGRLLYVASAEGLAPKPDSSVFAASQAGAIALMRTAAVEVRESGITINTICPDGGIDLDADDVPQLLEAAEEAGTLDQDWRGLDNGETCSLGPLTTPGEILAAIMFLASDQAGAISGLTFNDRGVPV